MAMNNPQNDSRALVSIEQQHPSALIPGKSEWGLMHDMAGSLVKTGFLPKGVDTPEKALAIMLKGRELNIPPMQALANIAVINGKPTVQAELMLALIYRAYGKRAIRVKESSDDRCVVEYRLDGWDDVQSYSFTIEQARKAGLVKAGPWQSYPAAMLRARCVSAVARMAFPECIAGMYVPGELGDDVAVTDDGEVMSVAPTVDRETGEIQQVPTRRARELSQKVNAYIDEHPEAVEAPAQTPLVDEGADREKANAYAHAVADGLFADAGHDVLHILASQKWGYESITQCNADQLRTLGKTLETKADDPDNFDNWFNKWIAPHMPEDQAGAE